MAVEVVMPRLSDSMEEGTVLEWLVAEGDAVKRGQAIVEIETDKATMPYEAEADGVLLRILCPAGQSAALGDVIAVIGAPGEAPAQASGNGGVAGRVAASPVARRVARALGVDLAAVHGSGPGGRVVRADVEAAAAAPAGAAPALAPAPMDRPAPAEAVEATVPAPDEAEAPAAAAPAAPPRTDTSRGDVTTTALTRVQQTIARRMAESRATVPEFELRVDVDMSRCVELRDRLRPLCAGDGHRPLPSFNDMIVKASALALREFPRVNGGYRDGGLDRFSRVNIGVAVAAEDALVVPTVTDADQRSLGEIARVTRELAAKVRDGSITPPELSGGTFTVSNLGMFGVDSFSAVINVPQAAILAVGALKKRPVVVDDEIVARPTMTLTLACDHRILYGADGARFLSRLRDLLEQPASFVL